MNLGILFFEALIYSSLATKNLLSQYFDISGFSPTKIGILMAVLPVVSLVSSPLWFKLSGKFGYDKIYYIVSLSSVLLIWPIFVIKSFTTTLFMMILLSFFFSAVVPLGDSIIINKLKSSGGRFDRVRLFGTIGFAITSLALSRLVGLSFFWLFAASASVLAISSLFISPKTDDLETADQQHPSGTGSTFQLTMMTVGMFVGVTLNSFHNTFIAVYARENGMDSSVVGTVFAITAFSEIPFLLFADRIIEKIGNMKILLFGMIVMGVRTILISYATNEVLLYLVEFSHGLTYILMYYSLYHFIHYELSGKSLVKAESLFWVVRSGMTFIVGSIGGGIVIDLLSVTFAFRFFGFVGVVSSLVMIIFYIVISRRKNALI